MTEQGTASFQKQDLVIDCEVMSGEAVHTAPHIHKPCFSDVRCALAGSQDSTFLKPSGV